MFKLIFINKCKGEVQNTTEEILMNVFIPKTPNPTSGLLILITKNEVTFLDMSVEDGLKLIASAGVAVNENGY